MARPTAFEDLAEYRQGILEVITRVVPCDRVGYNEITPEETLVMTVPEFDQRLLPKLCGADLREPADPTGYERTRDGRPYRISDVIDQKTFHALALYQQFFRPLGVEWQVAFTLPARAPLIVGIALTRTLRGLHEREVSCWHSLVRI